ncbi:hypothetical protein AO724_13885 [Aeromonas allosaccharophila]|nr:hypothetical protein AO724_13885 [Aeromonas allosaccharophila]
MYGVDMSQVFRVVNTYYEDFESYDCVFTFKTIRFWLCLISLAFFISAILWRFEAFSIPHANVSLSNRTFFVFLLEFCFLMSCFSLNLLRDEIVVSRMQGKLKTNEKKLSKLKLIWLQKTVGVGMDSYLSLAKELDQLLDLRKKHNNNFSPSLQTIVHLIYTSDAKNRILALFISVSAATVALSISAGSNINDVFSFIQETGWHQFFILDATIAFGIFASIVGIRLMAWMIYVALYKMSDKVKGVNDIDHFRVSLFINQLLLAHTFKKAKITVSLERNN